MPNSLISRMKRFAFALPVLVIGGCMTPGNHMADEFTRVVTLSTPNSTVSKNSLIAETFESEIWLLDEFDTFHSQYSAHTIRTEVRFKTVAGRVAAEASIREMMDRFCGEYPGLRVLDGPEADAAAEDLSDR